MFADKKFNSLIKVEFTYHHGLIRFLGTPLEEVSRAATYSTTPVQVIFALVSKSMAHASISFNTLHPVYMLLTSPKKSRIPADVGGTSVNRHVVPNISSFIYR